MRKLGPPGSVERQLGWVISLAGVWLLLVLVLQIPQGGDHPPWWQEAGGIVLGAIIVVTAAFGRVLPTSWLVGLWIAFPVILGLLGLASFAPTGLPIPDDHRPWPWGTEAVAYSYLALVVRRPWEVFAYPVLISGSTLVSAFLFGIPLDAIPEQFAADIPMLLTPLGFAVFFLALRARLRVFQHSAEAVRVSEERSRAAAAEAYRRQQFGLLVHDNVLSVLNAGLLLGDTPSDELRSAAKTALDLLDRPDSAYDVAPIGGSGRTAILGRAWELTWLRIDPHCDITVHDLGGEIPLEVAGAIEAAAAEALRNSLRHAGAGSARSVTARLASQAIEVRVTDDGPGFAVEAITDERMGVRRSIIERIERVGGTAAFTSSPGARTEVVIAWPANN